MSDPIVLSDEEIIDEVPETPVMVFSKRPRIASDLANIPVIVLDDDPTPESKTSGLSFRNVVVPETPQSDAPMSSTIPELMNSVPCLAPMDLCGILSSASKITEAATKKVTELPVGDVATLSENCVADEILFTPSPPRFLLRKDLKAPRILESKSVATNIAEHSDDQKKDVAEAGKGETSVHFDGEIGLNKPMEKKAQENETESKGERKKKKEEEKLLKAASKAKEKLLKAAHKAQVAELKKTENQKKRWESGKFALKSIVVEVDTKVLEQGAIGGHLLSKFSEKNLSYLILSHPIEKCVIWRMNIPEEFSQLKLNESEVQYVLLVYDAEEFCNLVANNLLFDHVARIRTYFPSYTLCFLTNRLITYINKREREKYKRIDLDDSWTCLSIEEAMSKLTTHYDKVHYRHCRDEAEVAEHVVGLTCSLASCQYRAKLTRFSVNANGSFVPKDCVDRNLIKKNPWLKALVAIPKVQPRFAIAIWKKYPNMKSLLIEYMNPAKSVYEKEFLLQDLPVEGLLGNERRVGSICSKRVYRIIMAKGGNIITDDVEDGADQFTR